MKKLASLVLICLIAATAFVGCNKPAEETTETTVPVETTAAQ